MSEGNVLSVSAQTYIDELLKNARNRKNENQFLFKVGEDVMFGVREGKITVEYCGTVIRVESDCHNTVYTVLRCGTLDYYTFINEDYGKTIFK